MASKATAGKVVLFDVRGKRDRKGKLKGSFVEFAAQSQFAFDLDVRNLVDLLRVALAAHWSGLWLSGVDADGKSLPPLVRGDAGRVWGVDSGQLATNWQMSTITGGAFRASGRIKPDTTFPRSFVVSEAIKRNIAIQSVRGSSAEVIEDVTAFWIELATPVGGDGVATPQSPRTRAGALPDLQ